MPQLVYRVVSACGALGYGFPAESLETAVKGGQIDAIVSDAGSMDAGPYYLGTGEEYFEREAVKADFTNMVKAFQATGAPVILGSSGMAGGDRNLDWMLAVAKEVFAELGISGVKVASITAEFDPSVIIAEYQAGALIPTGNGPELNETALSESTIVGQMGIHPIITALDAGAQFVFAGRSCDVALFAADMIRKGIDAGLAYHVGHMLECGALACDPGSPSDCLVAEIYEDGTAVFVAPNPDRAATPYSVAAHSLYEEGHPELQFYPEGILAMEHTEFFPVGEKAAGIKGSRFVHAGKPWPLSIKLEGSRHLGARRVSLVHLDPADLGKVPDDILVYGRNGVQLEPVAAGDRELGLIVETTSDTREGAELLASLLTHYLIHYGYPGRRATAGNIAYPLSPNLVGFQREDGSYGAIVPSGTRDSVFFENYPKIKEAVIDLIRTEFPDAFAGATFQIIEADAAAPVALLLTTSKDPAELIAAHNAEIARLEAVAPPQPGTLLRLDTDAAYGWSLFHLFANEPVITDQAFEITYYDADGADWTVTGTGRPVYTEIGEKDYTGDLDVATLSVIEDAAPDGPPATHKALLDMALVIRSKDAGINQQTYDIVFHTKDDYEAALRSNLFSRASIAEILDTPTKRVIGTYHVGTCNAIKITLQRRIISASPDERDVFGAQQQRPLEALTVPIYTA
jgi:hypothetical protein